MNTLSKLIFLFVSTAASAGTLVGNGGQVVTCRHLLGAKFIGTFTLDYVLAYKSAGTYAKLASVTSLEQSIQRIDANLGRQSPILQKSFRDFVSQMFRGDQNSGRVWTPTELKDVNSGDQEISTNLPANCYRDGTKKDPNVEQAVIRRYMPHYTEYLYEQTLVDELNAKAVLQLSFLMVHEWLWDFSANASKVRELNWILHSVDSDKMTVEELSQFFLREDFFNRALPVCNRSAEIKTAIMNQLNRPCDQIETGDLLEIENLDLCGPGNADTYFRSGDFAGLFALKTLNLSGRPGVIDALPPFSFTNLLNLEILDLRNDGVSELREDLKQGLSKANILLN